MLNNKGQSLVMFVFVIPILLMVLVVVLDVGRMYLERRELDNINYIALDYALLKNNEENVDEKIVEIIKKNNQEISVIKNDIIDNKIYLVTEKAYKGYFLGLIGKKKIIIKSSFVGYQHDNKKYIERVKYGDLNEQ